VAIEPTASPEADPGGAQAAIDRYRTLAKWIIGVFAAVGALLVAGSQLSSLGQLSLEDDLPRISAAVVALALSLASAMYIVQQALSILKPVEMSFDQLVEDDVVAELEKYPAQLPFGAETVRAARDEYRDSLADPNLTDEEKDPWRDQAIRLLRRASYLKVRAAFDQAWRKMAVAASLGAAAILIFAYAANPEDPEAASPSAVPPRPVEVAFTLTAAGREALSSKLGAKCVAQKDLEGIAIGGTESEPLLISLPGSVCEVARFSLPSEWGVATSRSSAIGGDT